MDTDRQSLKDELAYGCIDRRTNRQKDETKGQKDRQMDVWMARQTNGLKDGWMDRLSG